MFTPADFMNYLKKIRAYPRFNPPEGVILCYHKSLLDYILNKHETTKAKGLYKPLYLLKETGGRAAVIGDFGIGAQAVITVLEELIALGVRRFISVGTAGTLRKDLAIGDLMVCEKAIRDEGTSHHYLKASKYSFSSKAMTRRIEESIEKRGRKFLVGTSWTIDAPYRETVAEVRRYQRQGVATVEMEASALFAVAEYRNAEMGVIFTISDSLTELEWSPKFHYKKIGSSLELLYEVAQDALLGT